MDDHRAEFFRFPRGPGFSRISIMSESYHPSEFGNGPVLHPSTPRSGSSPARRDPVYFPLAMLLLIALAPPGWSQGTATTSPTVGLDLHPVAVWPSGPLQVIAAFARPIEPSAARSLIGRTIAYSETPSPVTGNTTSARPSGSLRIVGARLIDDGRTLVLATDPHPRVARYHLPGSLADYDLTGVEAAWSERDDPAEDPNWSGWWPELDIAPVRRLARNSKPHEAGLARLARPGKLTLSTLIRLPAGRVTLRVDTSGPIEEAMLGDAQAGESSPDPKDGTHHAQLAVESRGEPLFFTVTVRTGGNAQPFSFQASYRQGVEAVDQLIGRDRILVPWAPQSSDTATAAPIAVPDLSGGDPVRGRVLFSGDQGRCAQCHTFRGQGGKVGPDLTEIWRKGRAEIYRSIAAPSAAIEPEHTSYTVATKAGQVVAGIVRAEGPDTIQVTDTNAHATVIRREEIRELRPSATSIMPPGLASALGDGSVRDLIAFLTSPETPAATRPRADR
jgi:putative heme-binding domain-containing protein